MKQDTSLTSNVNIIGIVELKQQSKYFSEHRNIAIIYEKDDNYLYTLLDDVYDNNEIDGMSLKVKMDYFLEGNSLDRLRFKGRAAVLKKDFRLDELFTSRARSFLYMSIPDTYSLYIKDYLQVLYEILSEEDFENEVLRLKLMDSEN